MCKTLEASTSGFYDWLKKDHSVKEKKKNELLEKVKKIFIGGRKTYGSPRIYKILKGMGEKVSLSTVERLMRQNSICAKTKKKFKVTTDSKHSLPVAENILNREFEVGTVNKTWASDITYIWTNAGWLYLAGVIDIGTRKIVGWAMGEEMKTDLVLSALDMAIKRQGPPRGLVHHSDRGSQYACKKYRKRLKAHGIKASMSRKGNCWDNAVMESFFHSLKVEHIYHQKFLTRNDAITSIFEWIEVFYNRQRIHSSLGFFTPECYERNLLKNCA